jgi:formate hydrogenlyase subunit 3/multisubunit Na+/H+ antiporter MnhD subunit
MDLTSAADDPVFLAVIGGHVLVLVLAVLFTLLRRYSVGGFFAWVATIASLLFGAFWFLVLGGGRGNSRADESVQFALDPNGGLWITLYIVVALVIALVMAAICRRGRTNRHTAAGSQAAA